MQANDPPTQNPATTEQVVLALHAEDAVISRVRVDTALVRAERITSATDQLIDETLAGETVEVTRVPVGRLVDAAPQTRVDGDITIVPVVREVAVVERRLMLVEEVHIRRVHTTERHTETITLREQNAVITRTPIGPGQTAPALAPFTALVSDGPDFSDVAIELLESHEEALVGKRARVTEEITLRKEAQDRVHMVQDTLRSEQVEIVPLAPLEDAQGHQ